LNLKWPLFIYPIAIALIVSCSTGVELLPVSKEPLLNDLNSKVWIVDQIIKNDTNFAPPINFDKDIFVFYKSGKCLYQPMRTLGESAGRKGEYTLHSDKMELTFYFTDEKWCFHLKVITEDTLVLEPIGTTDLNFKLVLTPFPEL
jgi:hypothetical protein